MSKPKSKSLEEQEYERNMDKIMNEMGAVSKVLDALYLKFKLTDDRKAKIRELRKEFDTTVLEKKKRVEETADRSFEYLVRETEVEFMKREVDLIKDWAGGIIK